MLAAYPTMPATVIAELIGWYSLRMLSGRVAQLRPWYLLADPAGRTSYAPCEIAQCDFWFPDVVVPVGFGLARTAKQLPVLTMVCGYSRWSSAVLMPSRGAPDLYAGWRQLIEQLGAVPRVLVWDGEGAVQSPSDRSRIAWHFPCRSSVGAAAELPRGLELFGQFVGQWAIAHQGGWSVPAVLKRPVRSLR